MQHHNVTCRDDQILSWEFDSADKVPQLFRDSLGSPLLCGKVHNPGGNTHDYFVSTIPNAGTEFSSQNWRSNKTSHNFLCNRHYWEQGDFIDSADLEHEHGIGADFGLKAGRHKRVNFNNYVRGPKDIVIRGSIIEGENV